MNPSSKIFMSYFISLYPDPIFSSSIGIIVVNKPETKQIEESSFIYP